MAGLDIPDGAFERARDARVTFTKDYSAGLGTVLGQDCLLRAQVEAAAPLIVAAELERICDDYYNNRIKGNGPGGKLGEYLMRRAAELRGEQP